MERPLWREILRRSLGSHDAAGLVGGMCHGNDCWQEPHPDTLYPAQRRDGALSSTSESSTRHGLDPFARVKSSLSLKTYGPSDKELVDKTAENILYEWTQQRKWGHTSTATSNARIKRFYLTLPSLTLAPASIWRMQHAMPEKISTTQPSGRKPSIGVRSPLRSLLSPVVSTCGEPGSDVHALTEELAIRRAKHRSAIHSSESQQLAEGTKVAHLRRRFSLFCNRHVHSARAIISADREWHLRAPDSSVRKARRLFVCIVLRK